MPESKNNAYLKIRVPKDLMERWSALHKAQATNGSEIIRRSMEAYIQAHTAPQTTIKEEDIEGLQD